VAEELRKLTGQIPVQNAMRNAGQYPVQT
jgi:hypothetical protein